MRYKIYKKFYFCISAPSPPGFLCVSDGNFAKLSQEPFLQPSTRIAKKYILQKKLHSLHKLLKNAFRYKSGDILPSKPKI